MISEEAKQRIQIALALAVVVAGARAAYFLYERHEDNVAAQKLEQAKVGSLDADYYVLPKKLYPYDLKSAKQLTQQPVWVKEGYRYTYYPYDRARRRTDFSREAGLLLPIQKLDIKDVVEDTAPGSAHLRQVMAVFELEGKSYALPVGWLTGDSYKLFSDEIFYIQDPRDLYKHWSADVWESIAQHQVKLGMNEFQSDFAIGMGVPERQTDASVKTVHYPNGGKPVTIIYR